MGNILLCRSHGANEPGSGSASTQNQSPKHGEAKGCLIDLDHAAQAAERAEHAIQKDSSVIAKQVEVLQSILDPISFDEFQSERLNEACEAIRRDSVLLQEILTRFQTSGPVGGLTYIVMMLYEQHEKCGANLDTWAKIQWHSVVSTLLCVL